MKARILAPSKVTLSKKDKERFAEIAKEKLKKIEEPKLVKEETVVEYKTQNSEIMKNLIKDMERKGFKVLRQKGDYITFSKKIENKDT